MTNAPIKTHKKRLTSEEFEETVSLLNITSQTKEIAYGVLVDGKRQVDFADKYGITKAAVSLACRRVFDAYKKNTIPPGYEPVNELLPANKAFIVRKWAEETKKKLNMK